MSVATVAAGQARYWAEAGPEKAQGGPGSSPLARGLPAPWRR